MSNELVVKTDPAILYVGTARYTIIKSPIIEPMGQTIFDSELIILREGLSDATEARVLFHEIIHTIIHEYSVLAGTRLDNYDSEELVVQRLCTPLLLLIRDFREESVSFDIFLDIITSGYCLYNLDSEDNLDIISKRFYSVFKSTWQLNIWLFSSIKLVLP